MTSTTRGFALLALTILIWGAYMPVGRTVADTVDPFWITALRYAFAGVALSALTARMEGPAALRPPRRDLMTLVFLGALGSLGFGLFSYLGVRLTRPEHAAVITSLTPINVALYRAARARRAPPISLMATIVAVIVGAGLVVTRGDPATLLEGGGLTGDALVLVASLCWTFYTIRAGSMTGYSPLRLTMLTCALGAPIGLALAGGLTAAGWAKPPRLGDLATIWPQLVYLFVLVSAVSILTWNAAVRAVGAQTATIVATFTPVIPFAWAAANGQRLTLAELGGVALMIGAILAHNLSAATHVRTPA